MAQPIETQPLKLFIDNKNYLFYFCRKKFYKHRIMALSKSEEKLMQYLWKQEQAFLNELLDMYSQPKPAKSTVATLLKRMQNKEYVGYTKQGRAREYYPLVSKSEYFGNKFSKLVSNFFDNSATQFASFFASETDLSTSELEELKGIIEDEIKKKEDD